MHSASYIFSAKSTATNNTGDMGIESSEIESLDHRVIASCSELNLYKKGDGERYTVPLNHPG